MVAAAANNSQCMVGVSFQARIGGESMRRHETRMLKGLLEVKVLHIIDSNIVILLLPCSTYRHPNVGWRCDRHCGGPIA